MKVIFSILTILCVAITMVACQTQQAETMVLLDEKISEINISESNGTGEMNEEIILSIKDKKSIAILKKIITTAVKQAGEVKIAEPEYDVMVEYASDEGRLPTHGIHLWLGEENEKSTLMYMTDSSTVYLTSPKMTKELRRLIFSDE